MGNCEYAVFVNTHSPLSRLLWLSKSGPWTEDGRSFCKSSEIWNGQIGFLIKKKKKNIKNKTTSTCKLKHMMGFWMVGNGLGFVLACNSVRSWSCAMALWVVANRWKVVSGREGNYLLWEFPLWTYIAPAQAQRHPTAPSGLLGISQRFSILRGSHSNGMLFIYLHDFANNRVFFFVRFVCSIPLRILTIVISYSLSMDKIYTRFHVYLTTK